MPRAVPLPLRQVIWARAQRGATAAAIATAVGLPARTVRDLLHRWRTRADGQLAPAYRRAGRPAPHHPAIVAAVVQLRRDHPTWGAGRIRVQVQRQHPAWTLPDVRTMQRYLRQAGLNPAPRGRRPGLPGGRARVPHDTWQVDAAEHIRLATGQEVSWLRLVDECSGAPLETRVFPPRPLEPSAAPENPGRPAANLHPVGAAAPRARG